MMRKLLRLLPCLAVLFAAGCSNYEKRFAEAAKAQGLAKKGTFAGAYSGKWVSSKSPGGGGNLRCILTSISGADYRADFHATWHGLSSEHVVVLHTKPAAARGRSGALDFAGTSKLHTPIGAGTYQCQGRLDSNAMRACYDATYDQGTFEMTRVAPRDAKR